MKTSETRSRQRQQRYTWHLHESLVKEDTCDKRNKPKIPPKPRSCSADSSKKSVRISCDVTNLNEGPPLEVVGTKSQFNRLNYGSSDSSASTASTVRPVIKSSHLPGSSKAKKMTRSREILRELQRQLGPSPAKKKAASPYVVLKQKNVHDMHNLVLELDNNLSFGSTSTVTTHEITEFDMGSLKNIQMDSKDLELLDKNVIGKGTYATVYKCQLHGTDIAVKVFDHSHKMTQDASQRKWKNEGELMMQLRHPHIVQLVGACISDSLQLPMLIFEYLEGGSLSHYIHDVIRSRLDHGSFFSIARDIALGKNIFSSRYG